MNYYLSHLINAKAANLGFVSLYSSRFILEITRLLVQNGYLSNYMIDHKKIKIYLKKEISYNSMKQVSSPGRRVYLSFREIKKSYSITDFAVFSTSLGLMTMKEIYLFQVGGELLFIKK